jgi:hypothetical protein
LLETHVVSFARERIEQWKGVCLCYLLVYLGRCVQLAEGVCQSASEVREHHCVEGSETKDRCWAESLYKYVNTSSRRHAKQEAMLLLDTHNLLIQTILAEKFASAHTPSGVDQLITDFDNVVFHVSNPLGPDGKFIKTIIHLSMAIKCYQDLLQYGAKQVLEREYKEMIIAPEQGYDFTIEINLEQLPPSQGYPSLFPISSLNSS